MFSDCSSGTEILQFCGSTHETTDLSCVDTYAAIRELLNTGCVTVSRHRHFILHKKKQEITTYVAVIYTGLFECHFNLSTQNHQVSVDSSTYLAALKTSHDAPGVTVEFPRIPYYSRLQLRCCTWRFHFSSPEGRHMRWCDRFRNKQSSLLLGTGSPKGNAVLGSSWLY
jgi:hypothetical protein